VSYQREKHAIIEQTEAIKIQRLRVRQEIEREGLKKDQIDLRKAQVTTQIAGLDLQSEQIRLSGARINVQIAQIQLGKAQDSLSYEQADRILSQQRMAASLQLKAIDVTAIREDIRHQKVMKGGASGGMLRGF
jgi:hypothetical protein